MTAKESANSSKAVKIVIKDWKHWILVVYGLTVSLFIDTIIAQGSAPHFQPAMFQTLTTSPQQRNTTSVNLADPTCGQAKNQTRIRNEMKKCIHLRALWFPDES